MSTVLRDSIDGLLFAICAALILTSAALWVWGAGHKGAAADARAAAALLRADIAAQRTKFEAEAREREHAQRIALAAVQTVFEQELTDAKTEHDRIAAGLRAGHVSLHNRWQTCLSGAHAAGDPAATASADAAADDRAASAARIVRAADEADAHIRGLQSVVQTYQAACGVMP